MSKVDAWKNLLEIKIRELFESFEPKVLYEAMTYYLFQEGKRIRPLFLCVVCNALGGNIRDAIRVGCAVEIVHNYSLIHDDLPALDNDSYRRGRPSCHVVFGEAMALLAGDALLTYAFEFLSRKEAFESLQEPQLLLLIGQLAKRAGFYGMVGGQALDIKGYENLEEVSLRKTAELFAFCFIAGGIITGTYSLLKDLEDLGLKVGFLFQMMDDYKDKDGFYRLLGEGLLEEVEELRKEIEQRAKAVGVFGEEFEELLELVLGGGGGIRTPGGL
ncbi:MAG: polyprenyl synthetase family protein [Aquificaceae bacterium]